MSIPEGIVLERPYILMELYTGNSYSSNDYMQGHILQGWQVNPAKPSVGDYVFFRTADAIQVKYSSDTYYLLDENKIIFSFSVV